MLINRLINQVKVYPKLHGNIGTYWFEFADGTVSETFYNVRDFNCGFAAVQPTQYGLWHYLDEYNNLSEGYKSVNNYDDRNGFARVIVDEDKAIDGHTNILRDCLGRHSINPTDSGMAYFLYKTGKLDWRQMRRRYFMDNRFKKAILDEELIRYTKDNNVSDQEISSFLEQLNATINQGIADHIKEHNIETKSAGDKTNI